MLSHCNSGCKNAPQCYVIRTLPVLLQFNFQYATALVVPVKVTLCHIQENEIWSEEGPQMEER